MGWQEMKALAEGFARRCSCQIAHRVVVVLLPRQWTTRRGSHWSNSGGQLGSGTRPLSWRCRRPDRRLSICVTDHNGFSERQPMAGRIGKVELAQDGSSCGFTIYDERDRACVRKKSPP